MIERLKLAEDTGFDRLTFDALDRLAHQDKKSFSLLFINRSLLTQHFDLSRRHPNNAKSEQPNRDRYRD